VQPRCLGFAVLFLSIFNSCSAQTVLRLPIREAKERLRSGNVQFILDGAPEKLNELARIDSAAPFYAALHLEAAKNAGETKEKRIILFTEALKSPRVRAAAVKKLTLLDRDEFLLRFGGELVPADGGSWAQALRLLRDAPAYKEALPGALRDELYAFYFREPSGEAQRWLDGQFRAAFIPPPREEDGGEEEDEGAEGDGADDESGGRDEEERPPSWWNAAGPLIAGRLAASRSLWGEALWQLRLARERGADEVFIEYPELLSDLGKAFQYSAPAAGLRVFLEWEKRLQKEKRGGIAEARYRLLFFAARMARQLNKAGEAVEIFSRAAVLAPDNQQKDACIWYLLDTRMRVKEENVIPEIEKYAAQWADGAYFSDILDRFSAWAAKKRRWNLIRRVFEAVNGYADPETQAKYAYICGRALEYGLLKKQNAQESAARYYKIAYGEDASALQNLAAIYYRALAAKRLERPLGIDALFAFADAPEAASPEALPAAPAAADGAAASELTAEEIARQRRGAFFDGFFEFGCAPYLYPYIREAREDLGVDELRSLAQRLHEAKEWQSVINVTWYFTRRPDYRPARVDVELSYPLGYRELLEKQAEKAGIESALLFALVRRESLFNARARSRAGALGLTQLMEKTGTEMARQLARRGGADYFFAGTVNLLDPEINASLGALYYRQLLDVTSSPVTAILSYNGGIGRLRRWRKAAADLSDDLFLETVELTETRTYGRGVLGDEIIYRYLYDL
jgi:soluble lytic murein transglycosylase